MDSQEDPPKSPPPRQQPSPQPIITQGGSSSSTKITPQEVLSRRLLRLKQLQSMWKSHCCALIEHLDTRYKEGKRNYGKEPAAGVDKSWSCEDDDKKLQEFMVQGEVVEEEESMWCIKEGCNGEAIAFVDYCEAHVFEDPDSMQLYTPCTYVISRSSEGGGEGVRCGKAVLKPSAPAYCTTHFAMANEELVQTLRGAGLSISSPREIVSKMPALIAAFVNEIQAIRRQAAAKKQQQQQKEEDERNKN